MTQPSTNNATVESPLSALRRKWWLALILCPVGAALGATVASIGAPKYTVETRLSVGAGELSAQAVPGFALARQQLAEDYARWVTNSASEVGGESVEVTSSPIPNSANIRIEGVSTSQAAATQAVNNAVATLKKQINASKPSNDPAAVLTQFQAAASASAKNQSIVDAAYSKLGSDTGAGRGAATIAADRAALEKARSQQALLDVKRDALSQKYQQLIANQTTAVNLVTVREPAVTGNDRVAKLQRYGLLGFVFGGLLSLLAATWMARKQVLRPARRPAPQPVRRQPAPASKQIVRPAAPAAPAGPQQGGAPWAQTRAATPAAPSGNQGTPARTQTSDRRPVAPAAEDRRSQDGKPRS